MQRRTRRHNYVRKFRRWLSQEPRISARSSDASKSTKDFSWHLRKENPFHQPEKNWRLTMLLGIGAASLCGTAGVLVYHPFFHFRDIRVEGIERINTDEFLNTVSGILESKRLFFLPGNSYFTADKNDLDTILRERFPLQSLSIQKKFPHSLTLAIEEKISTIIYDDGATYMYLGLDGHPLETIRRVGEHEWTSIKEAATSALPNGDIVREEKIIEKIHTPSAQTIVKEMGEYPIVYRKTIISSSTDSMVTSTPLLSKKTIQSIIAWYQKLAHENNTRVGYFSIEERERDGVIHMRDGWSLKTLFDHTVDDQFARFMIVFKEHASKRPSAYVDVRYPERVYWK